MSVDRLTHIQERKSKAKQDLGTKIYQRKKHGQKVDERLLPTAAQTEQIESFRQAGDMPREEISLVLQALSSHFIFSSLDENGLLKVVADMKKYVIAPATMIFEQGAQGLNFYVITEGECEVVINGKVMNYISAGQGFGELALLHNSPRTATVRSVTSTVVWGIDRKSFNSAVRAVSIANYSENLAFIRSVPLFNVLNPSEQDCLAQSLTDQKFEAGQRIVNEGDPGELFYLIKEGVVSCTQKGAEIRRLMRGDYFGEQALLYNCRRTATVTAVEGVVQCLSIGRLKLEQVLGSQLQHVIYRNSILSIMEKYQGLSKLSQDQMVKLIEAMTFTTYTEGSTVVRAGLLKGARLLIILKGALKHKKKTKAYAEARTCLGEDFIMMPLDAKYRRDLVAMSECDIAEISREAAELALGSGIKESSDANQLFAALKKSEIFRGLAPSHLTRICRVSARQQLRQVKFSDGQLIFEQGSNGFAFYIIAEGNVRIVKDGNFIRTITKLDYFGERSILLREVRSATTIAQGEVVCWTMSQDEFLSVIDSSIVNHLKTRIAFQDEKAELSDLVPVKVIGKGMFGVVVLVQSRPKGTLYALKAISRAKIQRYRLYENTLMEKRVLSQIDHMLIMKLVRTYRDDHFIYLLSEYVNGLDLFDVLRKMDNVKDSEAKFFVASLLLVLEHMHERNIVYRDLKPENVMVDEHGYLKLIDFGTAKILTSRTFTIVGTPHYMAPEIILNKGYAKSADFWSLGIMLYEFIIGKVPYGNDKDDPYEIYQTILKSRLTYPAFMSNGETPSIVMIEQLLSKDPSKRTLELHRANPWLADFDWVSPM
jgi:cGMP-dependent protein kinase